MPMKSQKLQFNNSEGHSLTGRLVLPLDKKPTQFAVFAHCFTCGKDLKAERSLSLALSQKGIGVLRFDFTGLGQSEGDFADSNFSSNVSDLEAAAKFLEDNYQAPALLIGHSLGGTASIIAGSRMESVKAIATIGAPAEPSHVLHLLRENIDDIRESGSATVSLGGRDFNIKSQFVEDLENHGMQNVLESMRHKALLVMHSPQDTTVGIENAKMIYESAHHPKSFISLDGADHLMSREEDAEYAGAMIGAWAMRYLDTEEGQELETDEQVVVRLDEGPYLTEILAGKHHLLADEPVQDGGSDLGPTPYELLAAGLGACTAMTIRMYTQHKNWPLEEVQVHLSYDNKYAEDCEHCDDAQRRIGRFTRIVEVKGDLSDAQKDRILKIANKCPVHKTIDKGIQIETSLRDLEDR